MRELGPNEIIFILAAVRWTLLLSLVAFLGGALGGALVALARTSEIKGLRLISNGYIKLFQGTPLLMQLFLAFFVPGLFGWSVDPWTAAALGLSLHASAFLGEIWRGALVSIARTQWEAGASLGLSLAEQLRYVIIPQSVRVAIPPTVGFLVQLIKNTSLAAVIGLVELTREGQLTAAGTYKPFAVYITVACIYFLMCFPLTQWSRSLERKLDVAR